MLPNFENSQQQQNLLILQIKSKSASQQAKYEKEEQLAKEKLVEVERELSAIQETAAATKSKVLH